jgi:DNA repair exonuclease SbcCD ATPase subunit
MAYDVLCPCYEAQKARIADLERDLAFEKQTCQFITRDRDTRRQLLAEAQAAVANAEHTLLICQGDWDAERANKEALEEKLHQYDKAHQKLGEAHGVALKRAEEAKTENTYLREANHRLAREAKQRGEAAMNAIDRAESSEQQLAESREQVNRARGDFGRREDLHRRVSRIDNLERQLAEVTANYTEYVNNVKTAEGRRIVELERQLTIAREEIGKFRSAIRLLEQGEIVLRSKALASLAAAAGADPELPAAEIAEKVCRALTDDLDKIAIQAEKITRLREHLAEANRMILLERDLADQACPGCGRHRPHCDCTGIERGLKIAAERQLAEARASAAYQEREKLAERAMLSVANRQLAEARRATTLWAGRWLESLLEWIDGDDVALEELRPTLEKLSGALAAARAGGGGDDA